MENSLEQLKTSLKEMFQFQNNDLNFGIYKIYKLKQKEIEKFIDENLESIVKKELQNVSNLEEKSSLLELELFLKWFNQEKLLEDINLNYEKIDWFINLWWNWNTEKLKEILKSQRNWSIEWDLENKIYNYILNFFELYYSEWDFGYNTRSLNTYKVEYDENYNGSDIMFHWKHKRSYYIKSANGFNSVKFELQNKNIEFLLETNNESEDEVISQNNNRETEFKHYKFNRIERIFLDENEKIPLAPFDKGGIYKVIFNLSKTSTSKEEIYKAIFSEILNIEIDDSFLFNKEWKAIFKSLDKDFGKIQDWNIKWFWQLKIKKDDLVKKYDSNFWKWEKINKFFDELDKNNAIENIIKILWSLDNKLNSFYIWNDSDFFIHKDLKSFLTNEKEKFIKNNILWDLSTILNSKIDNTTLIIAKTFNEISNWIIEFLSAIEEFQKWIFETKKKVLVSEYCITLDKIDESFYKEILENKEQIIEWKNLWFISDEKVLNLEYLKANQTLSIDTKFFSQTFKDNLLSTIEKLEDNINWILINSENFQALNLLKNKYRRKVKCIYIDPPYNTGWDGFIYKDSFKHSSWLSMMENRLTLAREFLSDDWVIFVSIWEEENANLEKLLKSIFWEENYISNITRVQKAWSDKWTYFKPTIDYLHCVSKNISILNWFKDLVDISKFKKIENNWERKWEYYEDSKSLYQSSLDPLRWCTNQRYYIQCPDWSFVIPPWNVFPDKIWDCEKVLPKTWNDKVWRWSFEWYLKNKELLVFKETNNSPLLDENQKSSKWNVYTKRYLIDAEEKWNIPKNIFTDFINTLWTNTIKSLWLNFTYSKPVELISYLLKIIQTNPNDIILDFFSWSGTTGQAVIELNKEDNWNRKYIWVEMWEYFDSVTKPRIQKVMYSSNWKDWKPKDNLWVSQIMKYQALEQYEDMLDKLEIDSENFPEWLDLKYLYKKEEIQLKSNLNLRKPFQNTYIYGKAKKESKIDLIETYNYTKGNNIESIKTFEINNKYYKTVKTWNILQIWRNIEIAENDLENIKEILEKYNNSWKSDIEVLEVNVEIFSLQRDKFWQLEIEWKKYDIEIIDESVFGE